MSGAFRPLPWKNRIWQSSSAVSMLHQHELERRTTPFPVES
jgi:hypothetical protein